MVIGHIQTAFGFAAITLSSYYDPKNPALVLTDVDDGMDISTLSTNLEGQLEENEFYVKNKLIKV